MKLDKLIHNIAVEQVLGTIDLEVLGLDFKSQQIQKGYVFAAIKGTHTDGHQFIPQAINQGASVIVCEALPTNHDSSITWILVKSTASALGLLAANYFDNPSMDVKVVGVTGTNGKTTTATLLYDMFTHMGHRCGLISTVRYKVADQEFSSTHTTPDALQLQSLLNDMRNAGCEYCFMEVSSHALVQERSAGLHFEGALFTNITHDHLDFHKTFAAYLQAKKSFFDNLPATAFALTNSDDKNGKVILQNTKAKKYTYALKTGADFHIKILENHIEGMLLQINKKEVVTQFTGTFNAYNLGLVFGAAVLLGVSEQDVLETLSVLLPVEGRFETIRLNGVTAIVDYAHTPDALQNVLQTINEIKQNNHSVNQLITVVGAGGDRDTSKRPTMGQIGASMSDKLIITSDNPRSENPEDIIQQIYVGVNASDLQKVLKIADRKEAIRAACMFANKGDIILIAGKGHEIYQEIKGVKYPFNDKQIVTEFLSAFSN